MYTILLGESNELITSVRERIMQRSKLVDALHFLVDPIYKGLNMSDFTVTMEYVTPVSKEYRTEILVKSEALYKNKLEYMLPFDTDLTKEAGKIEVQLTFVKVELDADGNAKQYVRKTSPSTITIVPCIAWCNVVADSALTALDQRLVQVSAAIEAIHDMNAYLDETKADNLVVDQETNTIQLTSNGMPIGDRYEIPSGGHDCGIASFVVSVDDEIIITLTNGKVINLGKVDGASGATFVPHIDDDKILTWTNDKGLPNPDPVDLNPFDEWSTLPEESIDTEYEWEYI
jgi:hypothetical protein